MKILLIEPFYTASHKSWADDLQQYSNHEVVLLTLPGRHWKWRMFGGAVELARQFNEMATEPDLILASDMLDLTTFLSLSRAKSSSIPAAVYFHENQLTYPWSPADRDVSLDRNRQYGFLNYTSALVADRVFFNSAFHKRAFLEALPGFLGGFPDHKGLETVAGIAEKSEVLPLGLDLHRFLPYRGTERHPVPVILWNHRWEYDKDPETFFRVLFRLKEEGVGFKLVVLGEAYRKVPPVFEEARKVLASHILHIGYASDFPDYAKWLWMADLLPVTSRQDFFGGSVVEAIYCDCYPLLPKRLAYPEHLPPGIHERHFYEGEGALYEMLKSRMVELEDTRRFSGGRYVEGYDWRNLVSRYDALFEGV